uniref:Uncharacterized protein n=1 Tax=Rhizophora mucronata TaxID=61149 RepID=A0A2P2N9R0_RHIMU
MTEYNSLSRVNCPHQDLNGQGWPPEKVGISCAL